jgi:hypothetical protein
VNLSLEEYKIIFMLLWNDSTKKLVSYPAWRMFRFPTHHILVFNNQCSLRYWMKRTTSRILVSNKSICCSAHRIRLESMGHPYKYIIPSRADKTFASFDVNPLFFTTVLAHDFCTCHKHKKTFILGQMLLHGKKYQ